MMKGDDETQSPSSGKVPRRKYKRHPKPDSNAPERPLTAYVRFSKDKRREYQDRKLSFSELAKQIGLDWQDLSPILKNKYLSDAASDWTEFRKALDDYHATEQYADYVQYLRDFASENPESNVKLPHLDFGTSSMQSSSTLWEADGSPISDSVQNAMFSSEPYSAIQGHNEMDIEQHFQQYAQQQQEPLHQYKESQTFGHVNDLGMRNIDDISSMPMRQDFSTQQTPIVQDSSNTWQAESYMSLNPIGPGSRYSRGNQELNETLSKASDAHLSAAGSAISGSTSNPSSSTKPPSTPLFNFPVLEFGAFTGATNGSYPTSVQNYGYGDRSLGYRGEWQGFHHNQQELQMDNSHVPSQHPDGIDNSSTQTPLEFDMDILDESFEDFNALGHGNS